VSAVLESRGFKTKIIDCIAEGISAPLLLEAMRGLDVDFAVMLVSTLTFPSDSALAREIGRRFSVRTIAIGQHVTALPLESVSSGFDFVVLGEPELAVLDLVSGKDPGSIQGIAYRQAGKAISTGRRGLIPDLDSLPFPLRSRLPNHLYTAPVFSGPFTNLQVSRGCPHECIYCRSQSVYGRTCRFRSVGSVVEEIAQVVSDFGIRNFVFFSDTFTIDKGWVLALLASIRREGLDISWAANSRVDCFDSELASAFRRSNCALLTFGIESGVDRVLDSVLKGTTTAQAVSAVKAAKDNGILTVGHFILGLPTESYSDMLSTIRFAGIVRPHMAVFNIATPYPGTALFSRYVPDTSSIDWSSLDNMHDYTSLLGFSPVALRFLRKFAMLYFYASPFYLSGLRSLDRAALSRLFRIGLGYI